MGMWEEQQQVTVLKPSGLWGGRGKWLHTQGRVVEGSWLCGVGGQRVSCPLHCKGTAGICTLGRRKGGGLRGATKSKLIPNVVL